MQGPANADEETIFLQLIYASEAKAPFSTDELVELLAIARRNNARDGISGMLVYEDGTFLQVLEGPEESVMRTFERIRRDPRHHEDLILWKKMVEQRTFGEWTMGFVDASGGLLEELEGYAPFFHPHHYLQGDDPDGSKALWVLQRFKRGNYRR